MVYTFFALSLSDSAHSTSALHRLIKPLGTWSLLWYYYFSCWKLPSLWKEFHTASVISNFVESMNIAPIIVTKFIIPICFGSELSVNQKRAFSFFTNWSIDLFVRMILKWCWSVSKTLHWKYMYHEWDIKNSLEYQNWKSNSSYSQGIFQLPTSGGYIDGGGFPEFWLAAMKTWPLDAL